jgi:hypothetical protein
LPRPIPKFRRISLQLLASLVSSALRRAPALVNWPSFLWAQKIFSRSDTEKLVETGSNIAETL